MYAPTGPGPGLPGGPLPPGMTSMGNPPPPATPPRQVLGMPVQPLPGQAPPTLGRRPGGGPVQLPGPRPAGLGGSYPSSGPPQRTIPVTSPYGGRYSPHTSQNMAQPAALQAPQGGVRPGNNMMGGPSVPSPNQPSLEQIQSEMARRQVGAQLGPRNGALAGYMMG